ncbi:hypothetical protein XENOCAPTIV_023624, partial [Xenoophorus captivus]
LRAYLARCPGIFLTQFGSVPPLCNSSSLDPIYLWPVAVVDLDQSSDRPIFLHLCWQGVNLGNLHRLAQTSPASPTTASLDPEYKRIGLVKVISIVNKTFILKDFFMTQDLDFLCLTETSISTSYTPNVFPRALNSL